jgi:hypothetical protein
MFEGTKKQLERGNSMQELFLLHHSITKTQGKVTIGCQMLFPITDNMVVGLQTTKWAKWNESFFCSHKF